jgi:cationic amino acid transporter 1
MGFEGAAGGMGGGVRALMRRKQVDSERARPAGSSNQLRKELSVAQLITIGRDTSSCSCFFITTSSLFLP